MRVVVAVTKMQWQKRKETGKKRKTPLMTKKKAENEKTQLQTMKTRKKKRTIQKNVKEDTTGFPQGYCIASFATKACGTENRSRTI